MIKILRIISAAAILLACGFFAAPFIFGSRPDPKAQEMLNSPGIVEKFSQTQNQQTAKQDTQVSPLVKQAQAFALFLNPPEPQPLEQPQEMRVSRAIKPPVVTPKFALIGTSIHPTRPELSLALIDEPGKGMHWVRQSSQVGHLTIEQIKNGVIVVNDGAKTSEIAVERPEKVSLVRNPPAKGGVADLTQAVPASPDDTVPPMPDVEVPIEQISKELEAIEQQVSAGLLDPNEAAEKSAAVMEKYMADVEAARSRITSEEAKNISHLGAQLNAQQNGTQPPPAVAPQTREPNTPQIKPAPRQRNPRRRTVRPRGGTPSAAPQTQPSEQ